MFGFVRAPLVPELPRRSPRQTHRAPSRANGVALWKHPGSDRPQQTLDHSTAEVLDLPGRRAKAQQVMAGPRR